MDIEIAANLEAGTALIARTIADTLSGHANASIAFSGGQTPKLYLPALAQARDWHHTRVTLTDERWVNASSLQSNERLLRTTFLENLPMNRQPAFTPMWLPGKDLAQGARCFAESWGARSPSVVMLGMGEDAHIASLFPGSPALQSDHPLCVGVTDGAAPCSERLSLSPRAILDAPFVVLVLAGSAKIAIIRAALADGNANRFPVALLAQRLPATTRIIALPEVS